MGSIRIRSAFFLSAIGAVVAASWWVADRQDGSDRVSPSIRLETPTTDAKPSVPSASPAESAAPVAVTANLAPLPSADGIGREPSSFTPIGAGGPSADDKVADQSVDQQFSITFVVEGPLPNGTAQLLISGDEGSEGRLAINVPLRSTQTIELEVGSYVAAVFVEELGIGTPVRLSVEREAAEVTLQAPFAFDFQFQLQDGDSEEPIPFADAWLERDDLAPGWGRRRLSGVTDDSGYVTLKSATPGSWTLTVDKPGYAQNDATFEMPGFLEEEARRDGVVSLPIFYTVAETVVEFELDGLGPGVDPSRYRIAHTDVGEQVRFDADGEARLSIGYYGRPLYLKLWDPGGAESVFYLIGGLPPPGEPHIIKLDEPRILEVDLAIERDVAKDLDFDECWIRVAFQSDGHERKTVGIPVTGDGVYRCAAVHSSSAMVSFMTTTEKLPVDWVTQRVDLPVEGLVETTLVVDQRPGSLRFVEPDGAPAPDVTFRVYQLPNTTGWTGSGITSSEGQAMVSYLTSDASVLVAMNEAQDAFLMDVPIDLRRNTEPPTLTMGAGTPTFVEATCGGMPVPSTWFYFYTAKSQVHYLSEETDEHGKTKPFVLHPDSQAEIQLSPCDYWMPTPSLELRQGRNEVQLYRKAQLRLRERAALARLTFGNAPESLNDWVAAGRVAEQGPKDGWWTYEVPAGTYARRGANGEPESTFVLAPKEAREL